ncbi:MAG: hypothetical protein LKF41_02805 [Bifidobacterium sp.]|nr:hypothetical protein [Bifidobacterium sp.]
MARELWRNIRILKSDAVSASGTLNTVQREHSSCKTKRQKLTTASRALHRNAYDGGPITKPKG